MDETNLLPAAARQAANFSGHYHSPDHRTENYSSRRKVQITESVFLDVNVNQQSNNARQEHAAEINIFTNELLPANWQLLPIRNHPKSYQGHQVDTQLSCENQGQPTVRNLLNQGNTPPCREIQGQHKIDNEKQSEMNHHQSNIPNQAEETQSMQMRDMMECHLKNLRQLQRRLSATNDSQSQSMFQTERPTNSLLNQQQQQRRRQSLPSIQPLQSHPEQLHPSGHPLDTPQCGDSDQQQYSSLANATHQPQNGSQQQPLEQQYQQIRNQHLLQQQQQRQQNQHRPQLFHHDQHPFESSCSSIQSENCTAQNYNAKQLYADSNKPLEWRPPLRRSKHISVISPMQDQQQQQQPGMDGNNNNNRDGLNQATSSNRTNQGLNQQQQSSSTQRPLPIDLLAGIHYANRMDCYADDREALADFERFFNNATFSDVTLLVGEEIFYAHRLILIKASEVFERMLSQQWNAATSTTIPSSPDSSVKKPSSSSVVGDGSVVQSPRSATATKKSVRSSSTTVGEPWETIEQIELVEDRVCAKVFPAFLRFLYCNHIVLHTDNTLPLLILADKYNVACLRKELISVCIQRLSAAGDEMIGDEDWEKDWLAMDRDQLFEFLKCSDLTIKSEFELWKAVSRWIEAPSHPERHGAYAEKTLSQIVPLIRFPFMTPDELSQMEANPLVHQYPRIFNSHIMAAYKFQALPLASRVGCSSFTGLQYVLRNYSDLRWDKRIIVPEVSSMLKYTEYSVKMVTRASAIQVQNWDWELKIHPKGFSSSQEEFKVILASNVMLDQTRSVEYLLSIVDDKKVLRSVAGKKSFSKTRYQADLEMEKRIGLEEILTEHSPLLVNDCLQLQLTLKPID